VVGIGDGAGKMPARKPDHDPRNLTHQLALHIAREGILR
jgi:hypothetical protein